MKNNLFKALLVGGLALIGANALAHVGAADHSHDVLGFAAGLAHPFGGWDHLLAMLGVGMWAQYAFQSKTAGAYSRWMPLVAPLLFVLALAAGAFIGAASGALAGMELAVAATVLGLGLMLVVLRQVSLGVGAAALVVFGLLNGQAHGAEVVGSLWAYMVGMMISSVVLHAAGLGLGVVTLGKQWLWRLSGVLFSLCGVLLMWQVR